MQILLASASPRRRELLGQVGLLPRVSPSHVDETPRPGEPPIPYALRVAKAKAARAEAGPWVVIAADTVVALEGAILGKPESAVESSRMLARLSGRTHAVHTAVVVRMPDRGERSTVISTEVRFRTLSPIEIERYVASGEPLDKAGAYAIQGLGGALVAEVRGSYTNVVGLPLEETLALLAEAGVVAP
jgi:septum formation protein